MTQGVKENERDSAGESLVQGDPSDLRATAVSGAIWSTIGLVGSQVLRLVGNLILAYLLFRSAFGVMALVSIFVRGLQMFSDLGVKRSIAQHQKGADPVYLNTAWTIQVIRGVALWGVCVAFAWPYASYYEEPMLGFYIVVCGTVAVLQGLQSPSMLVLSRRVSLRTLAFLKLGGHLVSICVMIVWALIHPSVWALVAGVVAEAAFICLGSHTWLRLYRPRFQWNREARRELMRVGKWMILSSALTFVASQGDRLVLGKLVSKSELGLYSIALGLCQVIRSSSKHLMGDVIFPLLSRAQHDVGRVLSLFLEARGILLRMCAGGCAAIAIGAPLFFEVLYDERYRAAGAIAQWIALWAWLEVVGFGINLVPLALGRGRDTLIRSIIRAAGAPLGILGFSMFGLEGVIFGFAAASTLAMLVLVVLLPGRRWDVLYQGLSLSLVGGVYVLVALLLMRQVEGEARWLGIALTVVLAGVPMAYAALQAIRQLKWKRDAKARARAS